MAKAFINPQILLWARERAGLTQAYLSKDYKKYPAWENAEDRPTFKQAQGLAKKFHVPFGYLYLSKPPIESLPIPDLRTPHNDDLQKISVNFREVLNDVIYMHDWYKEYLVETGNESLPFVGKFSKNGTVEEIAKDICSIVGEIICDRDKVTSLNHENFQRSLTLALEKHGVWVMCRGVVGSNTHRALNEKEFRGFAIADDIAPLIFINGADAKAAQIFTLFHELAHIWTGNNGISNNSIAEKSQEQDKEVEKLCNEVAGYILVPETELTKLWDREDSVKNNAAKLIKTFKVSSVVISRRAHDVGLADWDEYQEHYKQEAARWKKLKKSPRGGGNYGATQISYNGRAFTKQVINCANSGEISFLEAERLLRVKAYNFETLMNET